MTVGLEQLLSEDSRRPIERMRLSQLRKVADAYGLQYDKTASKDLLLPLIEASGIDVTKPLPHNGERLLQAVPVKKESGQTVIEYYPVRKPHYSEQKGVDHDAIRERLLRAKEENQEQTSVIVSQQTQIDELKKELERLEAIVSKARKKPVYQQAPHELPPMQLRSFLKREYGISLPRTANKIDMLKALEKAGYNDEQDAT